MRSLPLTTLSLVATAACTGPDPVPGDWNIEEMQSGGSLYVFPLESAQVTRTARFELGEDGLGEWISTYDVPNEPLYDYTLELHATTMDHGEWIVENDFLEMRLMCRAERNDMSCNGNLDGGGGIRFVLTRMRD